MTVGTNNSVDIPISDQTLTGNIPRIAIASLGWLTLFFTTGFLSRLLIPQVRTLKAKEQMFWQLACVRAVCGFLTIWAFRLAFFDGRLGKDHVLASTDEAWAFFTLMTGFFIFEEFTLIYFDIKYKTFSKELHMHHFFAFNGFFLAIFYNRGFYYGAKAFILEASTPFSCVCWCLLKLKLEKTFVWKLNQMILIHVFHLRSAYEMWWWYDIYTDWHHIKATMPILYTANMIAGLSIVSLWLTPYWTYKKTVQFFFPTDWNDGKKNAEGTTTDKKKK